MITNQNSVMGYRVYAHTHTHTRNNILHLQSLILIVTLWVGCLDVGWGQVIERNLLHATTNLTYTNPVSDTYRSFFLGAVPGWFSSYNTPHHVNVAPPVGNNASICTGGTTRNCLSSGIFQGAQWNEGIFTNVPFTNNNFYTYDIGVTTRNLPCANAPARIRLSVCNSLVNSNVADYDPVGGNTPTIVPVLTQSLPGGSTPYPVFINGYKPTQNFSQLEIFVFDGQDAAVNLSDVFVRCVTNALTDISFTNNSNNFSFGTIATNGSPTFDQYEWNFGDPATLGMNKSSLANPTHSFSAPGAYRVTLTIKDVNGCCATRYKDVVVGSPGCTSCLGDLNCFCIGNNVSSITYLSALVNGTNPIIPNFIGTYYQRFIQNQCLQVTGTLIVDIPIVFDDVRFRMQSGAKVEIASWGVNMINSDLRACSNMWRGIDIRVQNGWSLLPIGLGLHQTEIRDAWRAVQVRNRNSIVFTSSRFYNNYDGVFIDDDDAIKTIYHDIRGCTFENLGGMKPAYLGQPNWSSRCNAGINITKMTQFNVISAANEQNVFKNLSIGIKSSRSKLKVSGALFEDTDFFGSTGILVENSGSITEIVDNNIFKNVATGIYFYGGAGSVIKILTNTFFNDRTDVFGTSFRGIKVIEHMNSSLSINEGNSFSYKRGTGIDVGTPLRYLSIDDNDFTVAGASFIPLDIRNVKRKSYITNNDFYPVNLTTNVINLKACSDFEVLDNEIFAGSATLNAVGFNVDGSNRSLFRNNKMLCNGSGFKVFGSQAVTGNAFCCNDVKVPNSTAGTESFKFTAENGKTEVRQNDINALHLNGNIGTNFNAGNNWFNTYNRASLQSPTSDKAERNQFTILSNFPVGEPDAIAAGSFAADWFKDNGSSHPVCATNAACDIPPYIASPIDPDLVDSWDPTDTLHTDSIPDCASIYNALQAIEKGNTDESNAWKNIRILEWRHRYGDAFVDTCLGIHASTLVPDAELVKWHNAGVALDALTNPSPSLHTALAADMATILNTSAQLQAYHGTPFSELPTQAHTLMATLSAASTAYNANQALLVDEIQTKASALMGQVSNLATPFPFLADRKKVWLVQIKIMKNGLPSVTPAELNEVRVIAQKCPDMIGQAVFEAQNIMHLAGEDYVSDHDCITSVPRVKESPSSLAGIEVYPNPAMEIVYFSLPVDVAIDQISLSDVNGLIVKTVNVHDKQSIISVDVQTIKPGIYVYKVHNRDNLVYSGKLIIIR
jgi:hypothetical protein